MRSLHVAAVLALTIASAQAGTQEVPPAWRGRYTPVSAACQGALLVLRAERFSYGDCRDAPLGGVQAGEHALSLGIGTAAACGMSGRILVLRQEGGSDFEMTAYHDVAALRDNLPDLVCNFRKTP